MKYIIQCYLIRTHDFFITFILEFYANSQKVNLSIFQTCLFLGNIAIFILRQLIMNENTLFESIFSYCKSVTKEFNLISEKRKKDLLSLSSYIKSKFDNNDIPKIIVICTHNSRRSHLGQIWLSVASKYYQLPDVQTFSGGTEATAFNPRAVTALKKAGFDIKNTAEDNINPTYFIKFDHKTPAYQAFSKKYDSAPNPRENFAAVLVCSEADNGCPIVNGADFRLFLPFDDPKMFDDTDLEGLKYDERCKHIAREMMFVAANIYA